MNGILRWAPVVIPILAFVGGGGWLMYFLDRRREKREGYRKLYQDFLLPLAGKMREMERTYDDLTSGGFYGALEGHPAQLRKLFAELPEADPRRITWKRRIDGLQELNREAIELINRFYGHIVDQDFKEACDDFSDHARTWNAAWTSVTEESPLPAAFDKPGALLAPRFPVGFEAALSEETGEIKRRAGL